MPVGWMVTFKGKILPHVSLIFWLQQQWLALTIIFTEHYASLTQWWWQLNFFFSEREFSSNMWLSFFKGRNLQEKNRELRSLPVKPEKLVLLVLYLYIWDHSFLLTNSTILCVTSFKDFSFKITFLFQKSYVILILDLYWFPEVYRYCI